MFFFPCQDKGERNTPTVTIKWSTYIDEYEEMLHQKCIQQNIIANIRF